MIHMGDEFSRIGNVFNVGERLYTPKSNKRIKFEDENGQVQIGNGHQLADGTFMIVVNDVTKMVSPERVLS